MVKRHLRLRVTLNKGRRGIALDKLERFIAETRKFLVQAGEDLHVSEPKRWVGVDFENSSLSFTNESLLPVPVEQVEHFNQSILALGRSEYPSFFEKSTADQFFSLPSILDKGDSADMAVFNDDGMAEWIEVSEKTGVLARTQAIRPYRTTQGAVQGVIHNIFIEAEKPYFTLRELSSQKLVKCYFKEEDYAAVIETLKHKRQVLHIRGAIVTETSKRNIEHIYVSRIIPAEPYGYAEVEKFLSTGWQQ